MFFFVPEHVYFIEGLIAYLLICLVVLFVWLLSIIMCYMCVCHLYQQCESMYLLISSFFPSSPSPLSLSLSLSLLPPLLQVQVNLTQ